MAEPEQNREFQMRVTLRAFDNKIISEQKAVKLLCKIASSNVSDIGQHFCDMGLMDSSEYREHEASVLDETTSSLDSGTGETSQVMWTGKLFPRYEIAETIGTGTFGSVFHANDTFFDRVVAIKSLRCKPDIETYEQNIDKFIREAATLASLNGSHVPAIYDSGIDEDGQPFFAMEKFSDGTLQDAISRLHDPANKHLRPELLKFAVSILSKVCWAVNAAHSLEESAVVHRDIKPKNILVEGDRVGLADWGLAAPVSNGKTPPDYNGERQKCDGSVGYRSPESFYGATYSRRPAHDIYALGATLRHILAGTKPAEIDGATTEPDGMAGWQPQALAAISKKAMSFNPEDRFQSAMEMATELECWLQDDLPSTYATLGRRAIHNATKNKFWWIGIATILLVAVTTVIITRQIANHNVRKSVATAEAMLNELLLEPSDDLGSSSSLDGAQVERRNRLERAVRFIGDLIASHGSSIDESQRASILLQLATLETELGNKADALNALANAQAAINSLSSTSSDRHRLQSLQDKNVGDLRYSSGNLDQARTAYESAIQNQESAENKQQTGFGQFAVVTWPDRNGNA